MTRFFCSLLLFVAGSALGQTVTGSGTTNTIPKWTGSTTLGNSSIADNGSTVKFGHPTVVPKLNDTCYVDGVTYATIALAQAACPTGTTEVGTSSPSQTISAQLKISGNRLKIQPGAIVTIANGGYLDIGSNGVLDAAGATINVTASSGNALQLNSGWGHIELSKLQCTGTCTSTNGVVFIGAEFYNVQINWITGFGGTAVIFTGTDGAIQGTSNNTFFFQHISANGSGIQWKNGPDYEDQDNNVYGGLVDGNTNFQVQFGDSNTGNRAQFNSFRGFADSTGTLQAPLIFENSSFNFVQAGLTSAIATEVTTTNSSFNTVIGGDGSCSFSGGETTILCDERIQFHDWAMGLEGTQYVMRDTDVSDGWWFSLPELNSGNTIQVFGGANAPPNPVFHVNGTITATGGKAFKIDHPLDPQNKYLYHTSVESPDMTNFYNGNAVLDTHGEAEVQLPDWFQALNQDFRYQLTCIGSFAPVYVAREIENNSFRIAGGISGLKVSWQVTGIRHDAYAEAHRIPVEEEKPAAEQGRYLHPELFGASKDKVIGTH